MSDYVLKKYGPDVAHLAKKYGMSDAAVDRMEAELAALPPLSDAQVDALSTLLGLVPVFPPASEDPATA
jgi:hypothetical protein